MSTITVVKEIEEETKKFSIPSNISEIVDLIGKEDVPEEILIYYLEIKDNVNKIREIEKFENIQNKKIRETKIRHFNNEDIEARKRMCEVLGIEYENEISNSTFNNTEGILSEFINNKIDPVDIIEDIRKN